MKHKYQIIFIHGGMTFKNRGDYLHFLKTREISIVEKKRWHGTFLKRSLGKYFEIIKLNMPLAENAKYKELKIHFERYIPKIRHNLILIGNSLGGIFLAKYLSEHKFPKRILSVYLVCPPFDNTLPGEDLVGGFKLKKDLKMLERNTKNLYLMFSEDDDIVPASHALKYRNRLKKAKIIILKNKQGHFKISRFPEIVKMIKKDIRQR